MNEQYSVSRLGSLLSLVFCVGASSRTLKKNPSALHM